MKQQISAFVVSVLLLTNSSWAALNIANFSIVGDTISFDLNGVIENDATIGGTASTTLYIGDPGDTDWVLAGSGLISGVTTNPGSGVLLNSVASVVDGGTGDYISLSKIGLSWAVGDSVDASIVLSGGTMDLEGTNLVVANLIASAGFNSADVLPDPGTQVGSAVPEPSAYALFAGLLLGSMALLRRKRS